MTNAHGIVYSTWTYDSSNRALSSTLAGPVGQTSVSYGTGGLNTVANALGDQQILTTATTTGGNLVPTQMKGQATSHLPVSTTTIQQDAQDFVSQVADAEGRVTTYVNDPTTGLRTSITRGAGTCCRMGLVYTDTLRRRPRREMTKTVWPVVGLSVHAIRIRIFRNAL